MALSELFKFSVYGFTKESFRFYYIRFQPPHQKLANRESEFTGLVGEKADNQPPRGPQFLPTPRSRMEHLPKIVNSKQYPTVRCLCPVNDSFKPFSIGYPERKGWSIVPGEKITRLDGSAATHAEITAFIQEWLFFGVLADALEIAGLTVNFSHFVRQVTVDESQCPGFVVTTIALRLYIDKWEELEQRADDSRRWERQTLLVPVLALVEKFFRDHLDYSQSLILLDLDLLLSILILAETLKNAGMYIWRLPARTYPLRAVGFYRRHNPLKDRLLEVGRCISETVMLHDLLDNTGLYIAASIPWPKSRLQKSHDCCTTVECVAYQVEEAEYKTAHVEDCPDPDACPFLSVDTSKLISILHEDKIPIIKIGGQIPDDINLDVTSGKQYIAFSHVWAQGLGNINDNALPRCQIFRLYHFMSELWKLEDHKWNGLPHIWIDTLCIPHRHSPKKYRKTAIHKLSETFSGAIKVLALDAELCQTSVDCFRAELATRVLCSAWMRRLWTLQEAVMTEKLGSPNCQNLCVQIREGPVALNSMLETGLYTVYYSEKAIQSVFSRFPQQGDRINNFATLSHALEYRTTSRASDEAICLASILGLDVRPILDAGDSAELRMCAFHRQISTFPTEILFHRGERLCIDGFRWAPSSFLSSGTSKTAFFREDYDNICTRDDNGLHAQFPGYLISQIGHPKPNGDHFHFADTDNPELIWRLTPEMSSSDFLESREKWLKERERRIAFDQLVCDSKYMGLIMKSDNKPSFGVGLVRVKNTGDSVNSGSVISAGFVCRVSLFSVPVKGRTLKELENREGLRVNTRKLTSQQEWCIF